MKKIKVLLLGILLSFSTTISAQQYSNQEIEKKFMPNTPLSQSQNSFFRFDEIGLNEYSGSANINIPLINFEDINLDLRYSAVSGNRVADESGIVGLGWGLDLGSIVQIVNDFDDLGVYFTPTNYKKQRVDFQGYSYPSNYPYLCDYRKINENCTISGTSYPITNPIPIDVGNKITYGTGTILNGKLMQTGDIINNDYYDSEPDIFKANFLGISLVFITDFSNTNNNITFKVLNKTGYKISLSYFNTDDIRLTIIDPYGTTYTFTSFEKVKLESSPTHTPQPYEVMSRTWKLNNIKKVNGNNINIDYIDIANVINAPSFSQTYSESQIIQTLDVGGDRCRDFSNKTLDYLGPTNSLYSHNYVPIPPTPDSNTKLLTYYNISKQNHKLINSIQSSLGKIQFYYSNREDKMTLKKLDSIVLFDNNQISRKKIEFDFDYFISNIITNEYSHGNYTDAKEMSYRLKLKGIKINGEPYYFEYNSQNLPKKNSFAIDYWGYYNGSNLNTSIIPNPIQFKYYSNMINNGNNLNSNLQFTKASILEKIIYPSKGYTTFDYELNEASNLFYNEQELGYNITKGNGLRISKIANFNFDNSILLSKSYKYFDGKTMIPLLVAKTVTYDVSPQDPNTAGHVYRTLVKELSSNNYFNVYGNTQTNFVGYDKVIIEEGNGNIGSIEKKFKNLPQSVVYIDNVKSNGNFSIAKDDVLNGTILEENIYDSSKKLLSSKKYDYYNYRSDVDYGVRISFYGTFLHSNCDSNESPLIDALNRYQFTFYPIFSNETLIKSISKNDYFENGNTGSTTNFFYDSKRNLKKRVESIHGNTIENTNYYAYESEMSQEPFISSLLAKNMISVPLETRVLKNGGVLNSEKSKFDIFTNGLILPKYIHKSKEIFSIENVLTYNSYDDNGNITQYTPTSGIPVTIIWGYNKTQPIAKIENANYSDVQSQVANLQTLSNGTDENALKIALNNLRSNFTNAMVTTYTYKPLIGISTVTDPKGNQITYEYDSLGRLIRVKDNKGKAISEYEYHYKN